MNLTRWDKHARIRTHNPVEDYLDEAGEVYEFLVSQLRTMTHAPFFPYLDQLIPTVRPAMVGRISAILASEKTAVSEEPSPLFRHGDIVVNRAISSYTEIWSVGEYDRLVGSRRYLVMDPTTRAKLNFFEKDLQLVKTIESPSLLQPGVYSFAGRTFTIKPDMSEGNLVFYHSIMGTQPFLIEKAQASGAQLYSLAAGTLRPMQTYEVWGYELSAEGWRKKDPGFLRGETFFDKTDRLRGGQIGFQAYRQLYPDLDPVEALTEIQQGLIEKKAREEREREEQATSEQVRIATEGLWFEQEIEKTIAKMGRIPDTVEASALRTWFAGHGVDVDITVRRYSMASGLNFKLNDQSEEGVEALARITSVSPSTIGILTHNRTGAGDILIKYPFVDSLATLLARRLQEHVEKKPGHYEITEKGYQIARGASISAMFGRAISEPPAHVSIEPIESTSVLLPPSIPTVVGEDFSITPEPYTTAGPSKAQPTRKAKTFDAWAVRFRDRLSEGDFRRALEEAKERKGWFRGDKDGQSAAFWFKEEEDAKTFASVLTGTVAFSTPKEIVLLTPEEQAERQEKQEQKETRQAEQKREEFAQKWEEQAERLAPQIERHLHPAIGEQRLTSRRARIASGMRETGERLEHLQCVLETIALMARKNTLPAVLYGVKAKTHIDTLLSRLGQPYPTPRAHRSRTWELIRATGGYRPKGDHAKLESLLQYREGEENGIFSTSSTWVPIDLKEAKIVNQIWTFAKDKNLMGSHMESSIKSAYEDALRAEAMGIDTQEKWNQALEAIEAISISCDPDATEAERRDADRTIRELEVSLIRSKIRGFHPTPPDVVSLMLTKADILQGDKVLEPSAGKGDIADAIRQAHPGVQLDVVEIEPALQEILQKKGYRLVGRDALSVVGLYDVVLMNPPFHDSLDIAHVRYAYEHNLKPGGRLVAIMSEGPFFREDKKSEEWRAFLSNLREEPGGVAYSQKLDPNAFQSSFIPTGVQARLVVLHKPISTESTRTTNPAKKASSAPILLPRTRIATEAFNRLCQREFAHFRAFSLCHCRLAEQDHAQKDRVFAHTLHDKDTICVCADIEQLTDPYLYGILAHEFGHILADKAWNNQTEQGADDAARAFMGVSIWYGSPLHLEYLDAGDLKKIKQLAPTCEP